MSATYKVVIRGPAGDKRVELGSGGAGGYEALAYTRRVNEPGLLRLRLRGDHPAIAQLEPRGQVEVWRRLPGAGLPWQRDFAGLFLDEAREDGAADRFECVCPGQLAMLGWRHIAYPAGTADRSTFASTPAAAIMWLLVEYNAGAGATVANGRVVDAPIPGLTSGVLPLAGASVDWSCAWANLLAELQRLQPLAGGDFDLVQAGPAIWEWRFFPGQRGADRTASVLFALERGNITDVRLRRTRSAARTVAIVGGPGEEADRLITVRAAAGVTAATHVETFVDARNEAGGLAARGDAALDAARARDELSFRVLQIPSCRYGLHYGLGDRVRSRFAGTTRTQQIRGVTVRDDAAAPDAVDVELQDV